MLDMGFVRDVRKIVAALPKDRQSLLFSATMPNEIAKLSKEMLRDPLRVEVTPQATPVERIEQTVRHVSAGGGKTQALRDVFADPDLSRVILFTRTKHRANRVAEQLEKMGVPAAAIHGNKSQAARQKALKGFGPATAASWWRQTSPPAELISTASHMSSISNCRTNPKVTFTGSGGQPEPVPAVSPSRSAIRRNANISGYRKAFENVANGGRRWAERRRNGASETAGPGRRQRSRWQRQRSPPWPQTRKRQRQTPPPRRQAGWPKPSKGSLALSNQRPAGIVLTGAGSIR